jgi:hypothetical protein
MSRVVEHERALSTAAALLVVIAATSSRARAEDVDPTLFHRYSLLPARTATSVELGPLPRRPKVAWKLRVAGGIAEPPTVSAEGSVLLALSTAILTQYDSGGRLEFAARLGSSPAATSPVVLGDGTRLVFTEAAEALTFSRRGQPLARRALPFGALDATTSVATMPDGGVMLASGRRVARFDAALSVVSFTLLDVELRSVLGGEPPILVAATGSVYELGADGRATKRGNFGGRVDAVVRLGAHRVLAVVNAHQLSELDTERDLLSSRFADPNLSLYPTLAATALGEARALTSGDALLGVAADGHERFRATLPALLGPAGAANADVTVDAAGNALLSRPGFDLAAIDADGGVFRVDGTACAEPLRPASMARGSAVFACRSGVVLRVDEAPAATGKP